MVQDRPETNLEVTELWEATELLVSLFDLDWESEDSTTMTDITTLLGATPLTTPRSSGQLLETSVPVTLKERAALTGKALLKYMDAAIGGMANKFTLIEATADSTKDLLNIYNLNLRGTEFKGSVENYRMEDVFTIIKSDEDGTPADPVETYDLFEKHHSLTLDAITASCSYYGKYGQGTHVQNLEWSKKKLLNSCDEKLGDKIREKLTGLDVFETGGPVCFKIMMDAIGASTAKSVRAIGRKLENLKLSDFDGENVTTMASYFSGACSLLDNCNALPQDITQVACRVFKTSSNDDFNNHMQHIYTSITLNEG